MRDETIKVYKDAMRDIVNGYCSNCKIKSLGLEEQTPVIAKASTNGWGSSSATKFFGLVMFLLLVYVIAVAATRKSTVDDDDADD
jgi:hypothetical protein